MQYRQIPKTGEKLSAPGFGCMRLSMPQEGTIDEARAIGQIRDAIDRGVNYLDMDYLLHALNGQSWDKLDGLGVKGFLDAAMADGRIKNAGFSFHGQMGGFKRIADALSPGHCPKNAWDFGDALRLRP